MNQNSKTEQTVSIEIGSFSTALGIKDYVRLFRGEGSARKRTSAPDWMDQSRRNAVLSNLTDTAFEFVEEMATAVNLTRSLCIALLVEFATEVIKTQHKNAPEKAFNNVLLNRGPSRKRTARDKGVKNVSV